jgi:thiaminase/transcriptional activator TenA
MQNITKSDMKTLLKLLFVVLVSSVVFSSCKTKKQENPSWTSHIWEKSQPVYKEIISLPFIEELAYGTLPADKFIRYLEQDEIYCRNFDRQLLQFAESLTDPEEKAFFMAFAQASIDTEDAMHQVLIEQYGIDTMALPSRVTLEYNAHTQEALDAGVKEVTLAAMLPCLWLYNCVGYDILHNANLEGNPYKEWIMAYGDEEYTDGMNRVLEIIDKWAATVDDEVLSKMDEVFIEAAWFEYAFWDYGYTGNDESPFGSH